MYIAFGLKSNLKLEFKLHCSPLEQNLQLISRTCKWQHVRKYKSKRGMLLVVDHRAFRHNTTVKDISMELEYQKKLKVGEIFVALL